MIPPKPLHLSPSQILGAVKKCEADRDELLDLLVANPECLDSRLTLIDRDIDLGGDRGIDLLATDETGLPTVVVVPGLETEDSLFLRTLDIPIWIHETKPLLRRLYSEEGVRFEGPVHIIVVATTFSQRLLSRLGSINGPSINLIKVQCLEAGGRLGLLTEVIETSGSSPDPDQKHKTSRSSDPAPQTETFGTISARQSEENQEDDDLFQQLFDEEPAKPRFDAAEPEPEKFFQQAHEAVEPKTDLTEKNGPPPLSNGPPPETTSAPPSPPAKKTIDPLDELLIDGMNRISALSDRIQASRLNDTVRFLLDGRILAEIRRNPDALEVLTDPNSSTGPIRNATDFESGLNRIITKFFRLEERANPVEGSTGAADEPSRAEGPQRESSSDPSLDLFSPARLTEEEINELYAEDEAESSPSKGD